MDAKLAVAPPLAGAALILPALDPYLVHVVECAIAAGAGALTFRLGSDPITWKTIRYMAAAALLGGILTPALGEYRHIPQLSYLLAMAFVGGMAADRLIRIIPVVVTELARRAAAGWAAAVGLPPAAPFTPGDTRPPTDPEP